MLFDLGSINSNGLDIVQGGLHEWTSTMLCGSMRHVYVFLV